LERGQLAVLLVLVVLTVSAWALTIAQARTMEMPMGVVIPTTDGAETAEPEVMDGMAMDGLAGNGAGAMAATGMASGGWTLDALVAFVVAWAVMMAAMMFPAAAPMLLLFQRVATQRHAAGSGFVPTWIFAAGYLLVWTAVGAITWAIVRLVSAGIGRLHPLERGTWAPLALGGVLILAGLYQLTPLKRVCLNHCRTPLTFVMTHWRDGRLGALRMGVVHGLYCLGCCWALFAVLVAAGVMSLAWMLLLTLVVFAEKVLPQGRRASHVVGVAFLILGAVVALGVANLPWTI
jgi:predicted metal-binding membrane protein